MTMPTLPDFDSLSAQIDNVARLRNVLADQRDRARDVAAALEAENADLQKQLTEARGLTGQPCSQCGQRTPVCADCGDSIIFVPKAGWGNTGEWQHLPPRNHAVAPHLPRPKVFVFDATQAMQS